ncbi:MAG: 50S ribosome-binding GTPase [Candidatus Marsarchaeota archaeon]|nr:50S ribosome-binding GTPase [Candidatus Marsarchaeota archaeon]
MESIKKAALEEKLGELKAEYSKTKDNKKTNKHIRILRAKIAKVKREIIVASKRQHGEGFFVKKSGDATIALVGFPNAGKSSLINTLTNTNSKIASYAFTTTSIISGMMIYKDAHIQIFDLPGLIENAHIGAGGGRTVISAILNVDLILFIIDINYTAQLKQLISELSALNIFINKKKPEILIKKELTGGIKVEVNKSNISERDIQEIFIGLGIYNAIVSIWDNVNEDELISYISGKSYYLNAIIALNKIDTQANYKSIVNELENEYKMKVIPISAINKINLDKLKEAIYNGLNIITIYLKPKREDKLDPMILKNGATIKDAARKVHTTLVDELKCAYVNGKSVKFANQRVGAGHILAEGDIVTFVTA